jgi:predicted  nucleic acid-binding Zn-ribbon protein
VSPDLEKLIALHELDLSIQLLLTNCDKDDLECRQVEDDPLKNIVKKNDEQLKPLNIRRQKIADTLPKPLVEAYERIKSRNGAALAEVNGSCCRKCNIMIRPQLLKRIRKGEQITICENCGRILYCKPTIPDQSVKMGA